MESFQFEYYQQIMSDFYVRFEWKIFSYNKETYKKKEGNLQIHILTTEGLAIYIVFYNSIFSTFILCYRVTTFKIKI